jgi:uncharacterized membrane protein (TIGR02234 family)
VAERAQGRRTFGPAVVVGLAGAGLAAMAGSETWVVGKSCSNQRIGAIATGDAPGVTAVALALLAAWGVLLVTRGRLRRVVAVLAALLSLGLVAAVFLGVGSAQDGVRESIENFGVDCQKLALGSWFWAAVAALPFAVVPAVAAVRLVPGWPEMGRRYDAPAEAAPEPAKSPEEQENLDLWKAMDEGRDPTT